MQITAACQTNNLHKNLLYFTSMIYVNPFMIVQDNIGINMQ